MGKKCPRGLGYVTQFWGQVVFPEGKWVPKDLLAPDFHVAATLAFICHCALTTSAHQRFLCFRFLPQFLCPTVCVCVCMVVVRFPGVWGGIVFPLGGKDIRTWGVTK